MDAERAERVAELVESALELEVAERINFLDAQCGEDETLRAEVESLLKFQAQASGFIESPAYEKAAEILVQEEEETELAPGDEVGGYRIRSLVGQGGMGEVYLADDPQLGRRVAIKLVKRVFGRAHLRRQFEQEERILAGLNHPHIARLYGAAVTADGLPYFVMEYVEGERLDEFCTGRELKLPERLLLFEKICSAVAYAHQQLIIHRDLKPANIRVTPEGEPKLLDFGIARLLDEGATTAGGEATMLTSGIMTPEYASPEQVRGERMTTASDVYSLGVLLYEMLAGEKPYRFASRRPEEISRTIAEQEPVRPSNVAAAGAPERKALRGDLDNIVAMAMRKEPERRYASVRSLAEDIRLHLEGRPVRARKVTWSYRAGKFVRRNAVGVAAAVLVAASLLVGIVATSWQARRAEEQRARAERRFEEVRRLARSLMFEIHDSVADIPGSTATRQLIVSRALEYLNSLAQGPRGDRPLLRELVSAYIKVGNVQGNPNNANLGDTAGALQSLEKAKALAQQLIASDPADAAALRSLGVVQEKMTEVLAATGEMERAVANARRSLEVFETLAKRDPTNAAAQQSLAISHFKTGDVLGNPNFPNAGDTAGALHHYQQALALLEALPPAPPGEFRTPRLLGVVQERLGTMHEISGNIAAAQQHYRASQTIRLQLAEQHPENTDIIRDAAIAHEKLANVMTAAGDLQGALESREKSLEIFQRLALADPRNVLAQRSMGVSHMHLGNLLGAPDLPNLARHGEALEHYTRAAGILEEYTDANDTKFRTMLQSIRERQAKLQELVQQR